MPGPSQSEPDSAISPASGIGDCGIAIVGIRFFTEKWDCPDGDYWASSGLVCLVDEFFVKRRVKRHIDMVLRKARQSHWGSHLGHYGGGTGVI